MDKFIFITIVFLFLCFITPGQVYEFKLLPDTGMEMDHFGNAVAISNDYAIVGATGTEKVYVFNRSGSNWYLSDTLKGEPNPFGSTMDPAFGYSVSISGNHLIVGAPFQVVLPVLNCIGSAYIFKLNNEKWELDVKLTPPEPHLFGLYGWTVAISNSFAVVGETGKNVAHIYKLEEEGWNLDTTLSDGYRFGESVAISENNIAVGTVGGSILYPDGQGSAWVFSNITEKWIRLPAIQASDGSDIDGFGNTVSISGSSLLVGDEKAKNSLGISTGAAYIFNNHDTIWTEIKKVTVSDGAFDDLFGHSVSISGDQAIISAPQDQDKGYKSGSAYLFRFDGEDWIEDQKLLASDGSPLDNFGCSVSICRDYAIVGAMFNSDFGNGSGSAYIYSRFPSDIDNHQTINQRAFNLYQNYPNPFQTITNIQYSMNKSGIVRLTVYDMFGRNIKNLVNNYQIPGVYSVCFEADLYSEGIYQYLLEVDDQWIESRKMIITK